MVYLFIRNVSTFWIQYRMYLQIYTFVNSFASYFTPRSFDVFIKLYRIDRRKQKRLITGFTPALLLRNLNNLETLRVWYISL